MKIPRLNPLETLSKVVAAATVAGVAAAAMSACASSSPDKYVVVPNIGAIAGPDPNHVGKILVDLCADVSPDPRLPGNASQVDTWTLGRNDGSVSPFNVERTQHQGVYHNGGPAHVLYEKPYTPNKKQLDGIAEALASMPHTNAVDLNGGTMGDAATTHLGANRMACEVSVDANMGVMRTDGTLSPDTVAKLELGSLVAIDYVGASLVATNDTLNSSTLDRTEGYPVPYGTATLLNASPGGA